MSFVFYDTETTGIDTTFDQILQFAGILTDENLNEIDRFEIRCQILPHVIPSPGALLATRVTPSMLTDKKLPTHYEAMCIIVEKLRQWSPAVFIGYNTLSFDEPLLRQAFYQNLHPVYLTNTNDNKRADVIRLVQAAIALTPNAITIPINDKGKPTIRLDTLAPENGFSHENAHDALADVEATIFIAKLIRENARPVWDAMMPLVEKSEVAARLFSNEPKYLVEYFSARPFVRSVIGCGHHPNNPTMIAVFDLTSEPSDVFEKDVDELLAEMQGSNRSIRTVYSNRMPAVVDQEFAPLLESERNEVARKASQITENRLFQERVGQALLELYPPRVPSEVVEERIYDGFPSKADDKRMLEFHRATWDQRATIVDTFENDRFRQLGRRLVFFHNPDSLTAKQRASLDEWLHNRRHGREGVNAGRTIDKVFDEIGMSEFTSDLEGKMVTEISEWLNRMSES